MATVTKDYFTLPGSKALAFDDADGVNRNGAFSEGEKRALRNMARRGSGATLLLVADSTAKTTTTLTDVTNSATASTGTQEFGSFRVFAGRWYEAELNIQTTNGTAANGSQVALKLSGTQTAMPVSGQAAGYAGGALGVVSGAGVAVFSSNLFFTIVTDTTSPYNAMGNVMFKPTADGILNVQVAEKDAGGGTLVVKAGSLLRLRAYGMN
jgi:hypothetical protein